MNYKLLITKIDSSHFSGMSCLYIWFEFYNEINSWVNKKVTKNNVEIIFEITEFLMDMLVLQLGQGLRKAISCVLA